MLHRTYTIMLNWEEYKYITKLVHKKHDSSKNITSSERITNWCGLSIDGGHILYKRKIYTIK